jgi:hypothetical protein
VEDLESGLRLLAQRFRTKSWHFAPCLMVLALAFVLAHPGHRKPLEAGFDDSRFPVDAATFLSEQSPLPSRRLYSSWQWNGYLIYRLWPSLSVFDDGRTDFYGPGFVNEGLAVWNVRPDWSRILDQYQVNAALLPVDSALASVIRERDDWKPVYQDRVAVLFARVESGSLIGHCGGPHVGH